MEQSLGRLEACDPRAAWPNEAADFTPWLASDAGLSLLSEVLGMDLELEGTEVPVGPYRADVVARDADEIVLIENQYGSADHRHLGQMLVYAAGLGASRVVWIVESLGAEHRAAVDWLNDHTDEGLSVFAIELRLWKIGGSLPAPQLRLAAAPNEFERSVKNRPLSEVESSQKRFWEGFIALIERETPGLGHGPARPLSWLNLPLGRTGFAVSLSHARTGNPRVACELYIDHAQSKACFDALRADSEAINEAIGGTEEVEWLRLDEKHASKIRQQRAVDVTDEATWLDASRWLMERGHRFEAVFRPRVIGLPPSGASET